MNILDKIITYKKQETSWKKKDNPIDRLLNSKYHERDCFSLKSALLKGDKLGVISEFKRKSPSKGVINEHSTVSEVTQSYVMAGVSGLSVLTDNHFFGGDSVDLLEARNYNDIPILRKDFIVDEYQIYESKSLGADVILLISEVLVKEEIFEFSAKAHELGMEVLMEIHSLDQLDKLSPYIDIIGVNNRNLKTFEVSIENAIEMFDSLPVELAKISESGINTEKELLRLKDVGYNGFLIGERFMKTDNPGEACKEFIEKASY